MDLQAVIDEEFAGCLLPLAEEEFGQLEANILRERKILEPIDLWNGLVIDGHNRLKIAGKHGLPVEYRDKTHRFADRQEVLEWIIKNQLGRRNLTRESMSMYRAKLFDIVRLRMQKKQDAIDEAARISKVSTRTIHRDIAAKTDIDKLTEPIRVKVDEGTLALSREDAKELSALSEAGQAAFSAHLSDIARPTRKDVKEALAAATSDQEAIEAPSGTPEALLPIFAGASAMRGFIQRIGKIQNEIDRFCIDSKAGRYVDIVAMRADLRNVAENIRVALPSCVCPCCKGEQCIKCDYEGWMTRERAAGVIVSE